MSAEKTVLVIDDDQVLVAALKDGLESLGFKVAAAYDGLQGVLQAHQSRPSVILLDFTMPAGGGASVYDRLRSSTDTARLPILFLTGVTVEQVKDKIRSTPNTYFLKKPVTVEQLRKVLEKILGPIGGGDAKPPPAAASGPLGAAHPEPPPLPAPSPAVPGSGGPATGAGSPVSGAGAFPGLRLPPPVTIPGVAVAAARALGARRHEFEVRVTYADTDRLGIIYYANYFKYFEGGRTELLRSLGVRYRDLEAERKLFLPVVEARCEYLAPSRYDDLLVVRTWLAWMGPASVCFQNEIHSREDADRPVARGFSRHAVVNEYWKPARIPEDLRKLLEPYVTPE